MLNKIRPAEERVLSTRCLLLLSVLLGLSSAGCQEKAADDAAAPGGRPPAPVYVETVSRQEVIPKTIVVGTIVAKRTSQVASGADGKVNQLLVREGDLVEQGQELSILNMVTTNLGIKEAEQVLETRKQEWLELQNGSRPEEVAKASADLAAAKSAMDSALIKLQRQRELEQNRAVNQDELDDAIERAETTSRMYESARATALLINNGPRKEQISQAESRWRGQQEQVEYLKAEKTKRTTTAPFRGVIVAEHTQDGEWLSKGDSVVTISDLLDEVYIIANVDQVEIANVRPGTEVVVEIDSPGKRQWKGMVESIIPRSQWETGARTFPVKVIVKNEIYSAAGKVQARLAEGMYARVSFTGTPREALLVPKDAVIRSENGSRVVMVLPGEGPVTGAAKLVMIQEGGAFGDHIEVLSGELQPGARIVTEGAERLSPFQALQIAAPTPKSNAEPTSQAEKTNSVSEESE